LLLKRGRPVWAWITKPRKWCEWAMVFVTVGILCYAGEQTGIATRQAEVLDRQTCILHATTELSRVQQRAWVGPTDIATALKAEAPFQTDVTIKNAGQSPALRVENSGRTVVLKDKEPFDPYAYELPKPFSRAVLLPGDVLRLPFYSPKRVPVTEKEIGGIITGTSVLYLIGEITYNDVFGRPHHTRFSRVLVPEPANSYWTVTPDGNEMD